MMKLNVFLVVCVLMYCVSVAVAQDLEADECSISGKVLKKGESYTPEGTCEQLSCEGGNVLSGKGCPLLNFDPANHKCTVEEEDVSKPYPDCCEKITCTDD